MCQSHCFQLENDVGIFCACLPSIQAIFKPLANRLRFWSTIKDDKSKSYGSRSGLGNVPRDGDRGLLERLPSSELGTDGGDSPGILMTTSINRRERPSEDMGDIPPRDVNVGPTTAAAVRVPGYA
jgi:hypothetical protein